MAHTHGVFPLRAAHRSGFSLRSHPVRDGEQSRAVKPRLARDSSIAIRHDASPPIFTFRETAERTDTASNHWRDSAVFGLARLLEHPTDFTGGTPNDLGVPRFSHPAQRKGNFCARPPFARLSIEPQRTGAVRSPSDSRFPPRAPPRNRRDGAPAAARPSGRTADDHGGAGPAGRLLRQGGTERGSEGRTERNCRPKPLSFRQSEKARFRPTGRRLHGTSLPATPLIPRELRGGRTTGHRATIICAAHDERNRCGGRTVPVTRRRAGAA